MRPERRRGSDPLDLAPAGGEGLVLARGRHGARRAGGLLLGLLLGALLALLAAWLYFRSARVEAATAVVAARLNLPDDVWKLEDVSPAGVLRIALRDVALLGRGGDTLATAPILRASFVARTFDDEGPLVFTQVELVRPNLRLIQAPDGEWTIFEPFTLTADGQPIQADTAQPGRGMLLRDVRIRDGRVLLAMPRTPADTLPTGSPGRQWLRFARLEGAVMRLRTAQNVDARLPFVRIGGEQGWRVDVGALTARLNDPEVRIAELRGRFEQRGVDGFRFDVATLRTPRSTLAGEGEMFFPERGPLRYSVALRAQPVDFADLQWILPQLPAEGQARLALEAETQPGGRIRLAARDLDATFLGSHVTGQAAAVVGGTGPTVFSDTRLVLDPLELATVEQLGAAFGFTQLADLPYAGQVRGTLATAGPTTAEGEGALRVDLLARLVPKDQPDAEPSLVAAEGGVRLGGAAEPLRLRELRVQLQPLRLDALARFFPEQRQYLRGVLRGSATVSGTPRALELSGGDVSYEVGDAPTTRLAGVQGSLTLDPQLRYDLSARAAPLELATLTELVPALPFRRARISGPLRVIGDAEQVRFRADLAGDAGAIAFSGSAAFGNPLRFDVSGRLNAFEAGAVVRRGVPLEGPLSGSFALNGTTAELGFDVDLTQGLNGRFALRGRLRRPAGTPAQVEVAGDVTDFRIGTLIGQPALFPSPMTGRIQLAGGGRQPYTFSTDLRGELGALALTGRYAPGEVPSYEARGRVVGLDVRRLPGASALPQTSLTGTIDLSGRGTTLETLAGRLRFDAANSRIGTLPVQTARASLLAANGVLRVDTLTAEVAGARLEASGTLGLTRPAPTPLRFSLAARDLARFAPLAARNGQVEPQLAGTLALEGVVTGSVRSPQLSVNGRGRGLRWDGWRAGALALELRGARTTAGWSGEGFIDGQNALLPGIGELRTLRLRANGAASLFDVDLLAARDAGDEVRLNGRVELEGPLPRAVELRSLQLAVADSRWALAAPTRLRWGGDQGLLVDSLRIRRDDGRGWLEVDGTLPPTGQSDLRVRAAGVDVGELRRLLPQLPDVGGVITLDATLLGPVADPEMVVSARVDGFHYGGVSADTLVLSARYTERLLTTQAGLFVTGNRFAAAEGQIPMRLSLTDLLPSFELLRGEPLRASLRADSLPLGLIATAIPTTADGAGTLAAQLTVGGTLDRPTFGGWAAVRDGAVTVQPLGVRYDRINASASLDGDLIRIDSLSVRSKGTARLAGTIRFDERARPALYLTATLAKFLAADSPDLATLELSGQLALSGRMPEPVVTGRLLLDEGTIAIPQLRERDALELADLDIGAGQDTLAASASFVPAFLAGVRADALQVAIGDDVWLESPEARIQIGGELIVNRFGQDVRVFGELEAQRGTYSLQIGSLVREFDIVSGRVQFFGDPELNPELAISAAHEVRTSSAPGGNLRVLVNITGSLQNPNIELTSETRPPLPESELLSYLIFGRPAFQLGGREGASAQDIFAQELVGSIFLPELERLLLRTGIPCDYLRVQGGGVGGLGGDVGAFVGSALGSTALACGIQISDRLFLTLETGAGQLGQLFGGSTGTFDPGSLLDLTAYAVRLEYQPTNTSSFSIAREPVRQDLLSRYTRPDFNYQLSVSGRFRWEYGRAEPPAPLEQPRQLPGEIAPPAEPQ